MFGTLQTSFGGLGGIGSALVRLSELVPTFTGRIAVTFAIGVATMALLARTDRHGSWQLFREALNSDIHDIQDGATAEGIHTGAMSGTVDIMHRCYAGLESSLSTLHFGPMLPEDVEGLEMNLRYRKHKLKVEVDKNWLKVKSSSSLNQPIGIAYRGDARKLPPGESIYFRLVGRNQSDVE